MVAHLVAGNVGGAQVGQVLLARVPVRADDEPLAASEKEDEGQSRAPLGTWAVAGSPGSNGPASRRSASRVRTRPRVPPSWPTRRSWPSRWSFRIWRFTAWGVIPIARARSAVDMKGCWRIWRATATVAGSVSARIAALTWGGNPPGKHAVVRPDLSRVTSRSFSSLPRWYTMVGTHNPNVVASALVEMPGFPTIAR